MTGSQVSHAPLEDAAEMLEVLFPYECTRIKYMVPNGADWLVSWSLQRML